MIESNSEQKKVSGNNGVSIKNRDFFLYLFYAVLGSIIIISSLLNVVMFVNLFVLIIVFVMSQIMHEGGHYLSHWISGREIKVVFNKVNLPVQILAWDTIESPFTALELTRASVFGIIAGVIPINLYFFVTGNLFGYLILQAFYIYASRFDIMDVRNSILSYLHNLYIDSKRSKEGLELWMKRV